MGRQVSRFITDLDVRKLGRDASADRRGTWRLLQPLVYHSDVLRRTLTVPDGFITDFASVPRLPVAFLLTAEAGHEAAVVHDFLYTTHEVERRVADAVFEEALLVGDEPRWRAWLMWAGVRIGGSGPWKAAGQRQPEYVSTAISFLKQEAP